LQQHAITAKVRNYGQGQSANPGLALILATSATVLSLPYSYAISLLYVVDLRQRQKRFQLQDRRQMFLIAFSTAVISPVLALLSAASALRVQRRTHQRSPGKVRVSVQCPLHRRHVRFRK
jgi:hypothetical protein